MSINEKNGIMISVFQKHGIDNVGFLNIKPASLMPVLKNQCWNLLKKTNALSENCIKYRHQCSWNNCIKKPMLMRYHLKKRYGKNMMNKKLCQKTLTFPPYGTKALSANNGIWF